MKEVVDLNGKKVEAPIATPVRTVDGVHYVLNSDEEKEAKNQEKQWKDNERQRELEEIDKQRNSERGSLLQQWEFFINNGYDALKQRDDAIKAKHPKGD